MSNLNQKIDLSFSIRFNRFFHSLLVGLGNHTFKDDAFNVNFKLDLGFGDLIDIFIIALVLGAFDGTINQF